MEIILNYFQGLWEGLFNKPLMELNAPQIFILVLLSYGFFLAFKVIFASSKTGVKVIYSGASGILKAVSPKHRASKVTCLHCGRTLDKCTCQGNKDVSFSKRLKKHKLELKALKVARRAKLIK